MVNKLPTAVVTGASSGIGATYAEKLAQRGHGLLLVARNQERLDALAEKIRRTSDVAVEVLRADLVDPAQLRVVEERLRNDAGIGLLVNNAGAATHAGFLGEDLEPLYELVQLNVNALTRLAGAAVQGFLKHQVQGAIVNIGSVVGFAPQWIPGVYGATKAYVLTLSQAMQAELADRGIYVQAVLPAGTKTEIWERSGRSVNDGMMDVGELVDAALLGYDRREAVTIPPLHDIGKFEALEKARLELQPVLNNASAAPRYKTR